MQHSQVLIGRPVDVGVVKDNSVRRDTVYSSDSLESHLVIGEVLISSRHKSVENSVLTKLGLDLLLVGLEGLVHSGVRCCERGVALQHDPVTGDQRSDRGRPKNQGGGIKLGKLGAHSSVEDYLVVQGVLVRELSILVGLVDLDEKSGLLSNGLLNLESSLGGENSGPDEADSASCSQDGGGVLTENQSSASSETGDNSEIHLIRPAFLSRR